MKLKFSYDRKKDIWCILKKGKSSNNSRTATKVYSQLICKNGENPSEEEVGLFIEQYLKTNNRSIPELLYSYEKEWNNISIQFINIIEKIFQISIKNEISVYLTINSRCPYNIKKNLFFIPIAKNDSLIIIMHELWHFYTWYKFGVIDLEKMGMKKYNMVKEALTVLINVECKHLLPNGAYDIGYPQHQKLRIKILKLWKKEPDIDILWEEISKDSN